VSGVKSLVRARVAVTVLFIVNGLSLAAWFPRLAEVQSDIGISDAQLGVILACGAAGGLAIGPLAGFLVARWNSARVSVAALLLLAPVLPVVGLAPGGWVLALALFWIGAVDSVMDGAMNAHGLRVQSFYGRSIINGFHAYWSLGAVAGAVVGSASLAIGLSITWMLVGVSAASVIAVLVTARWLLPGSDPDAHLSDAQAATEATSNVDPAALPIIIGRGAILIRLTVLLGLFTVMAVIVEDIPARWSSIYLTEIGAAESIIGVAFTAFTIAMMLGRFAGDRTVNRFGEARVVQVSMAVSAAALAAALLIGRPWAYIGACVVIGWGVATLFPAAMHAATQIPGVRPAMGVATVGWLARAGFVLAPLAVGLVAERFGIAWALTVPIIAALILVPLSAILRPRTVHPIP